MSHSSVRNAPTTGLKQNLSSGQMAMIALGGAIGTGLFMGSKLGIELAGSSVIISYLIGGLIALVVMGALAELTVHRPEAGAFGHYAEKYLGNYAGFLTRYLYWSALVFAVGTEVSVVGQYMQLWFPQVPSVIWVAGFSAALLGVNMSNVKAFGSTEYWFSAIKVFAVLAFVIVAGWLVLGSGNPGYSVANYVAESGFLAGGIGGMWAAVIVAIFSYMGVEVIAIAAAEARDARNAVKRAFRITFLRLLLFYIATLSLILAMAPRSELLDGGSPFVTVMGLVGIPFADTVLNFVLIVAALSAMNAQLYAASRTLNSLSRAGHAPRIAGRIASNGAPVHAVWMSAGGIAIAAVVYALAPGEGLGIMISLATFGAMATWLMILLTHVVFRRKLRRAGAEPGFRLPGFPAASLVGAALLAGLLVTSLFTEQFRLTLVFGLPFVLLISTVYGLLAHRQRALNSEPVSSGSTGNY
ncbi:amino acid permease [Glutamicibacter sp. MNS18]|uniref:amino acid permease n=1 Tax=Glutamicibacter sp. MNS18 TaxID=2989817 RepID=UPI002236976E|nr:amino acid permease [Glutamicibacter sp. MNS18]MCW4465987.1 amino acid permease [Glutamicibacter sp. MNS18]